MSDVDRRVQGLVERSARSIDGGSIAPRVSSIEPGTTRGAGQASKSPSTVNPPAEGLRYDVVSETRDVASRLDAYSKAEIGDQAKKLDLSGALRTAQTSAREYLDAEEEYVLAATRLLIERHLWGPRFFNDTTLSMAGQGTDGDFRSALKVVNDLKVQQRLPYGGTVEAGLLWTATDQLRETAGGRYVQSSELVLSGTVPLLRGAGLVAQESLIQAERNLVYQARLFETFRRQFFVAVSRDYFDLLESRAVIGNQETTLANLKEILRGEEARFNAGRIAEFRKNIAANDVLQATATLAGLREGYILALDRFKSRLGLSLSERIDLDPAVPDLPEPATTPDRGAELALEFRLDLQNSRDHVDDSRRAVANAKNATLPDLNVSGSVGVPTDPRKRIGGLRPSPEDLNYEAAVTLGLPLDREIERLGVRQATIALQQSQRAYEKFRDDVIVSVRQAVRNIDLGRFQLTLAEKQVEINKRRIEELRLKSDTVETQTKVDAAAALQQAENSRDRARTQLRTAILDYLLQSGQLRVARDGTFQPLPGMEQPAQPLPPDEPK